MRSEERLRDAERRTVFKNTTIRDINPLAFIGNDYEMPSESGANQIQSARLTDDSSAKGHVPAEIHITRNSQVI